MTLEIKVILGARIPICTGGDCLENMGSSTSHKRMGLHGLLLGQLDLTFTGLDMYICSHQRSF
jgi:hypothetical protein